MVEIGGKNGVAKVFNDIIEETALSQITAIMESPATENATVRIMPDVHAGAGCVIGYTATLTSKVIPNLIGVDIGCGIRAVRINEHTIDYQALDDFIRENIPSGFSVRNNPDLNTPTSLSKAVLGVCREVKIDDFSRTYRSIGTLGGGNHFIEIDKDNTGNYWLLVHTGSRNFGLKIANFYQKIANNEHKDIKGGLAYLEGENAKKYFYNMNIAQRFAIANRESIINTIVSHFQWNIEEDVESVHNYIDFEDNVIRKGAIRAHKGDRVVIPFSMADGAIIGVGKGNDDWNNSAPHGAGRVLSRKKAKTSVSIDDFKAVMDGVWSSSINENTLDESPFAYKNADEIIAYIDPTVEIQHRLIPVYNFKAS